MVGDGGLGRGRGLLSSDDIKLKALSISTSILLAALSSAESAGSKIWMAVAADTDRVRKIALMKLFMVGWRE